MEICEQYLTQSWFINWKFSIGQALGLHVIIPIKHMYVCGWHSSLYGVYEMTGLSRASATQEVCTDNLNACIA